MTSQHVGAWGKKAHIQVLICPLVCAPKLVCALLCSPKLVCALIWACKLVFALVCALIYALIWVLLCAPKLVWALVFVFAFFSLTLPSWPGQSSSHNVHLYVVSCPLPMFFTESALRPIQS